MRTPVPIGVKARLSERSDAELETVVTDLRANGVRLVREDISWATLEPAHNVFDWSSMDRWMAVAARHGLRIMALPGDAPRWATPSWNIAPASGQSLAEFAEFVRALLQRYGTNGAFWRAHPELPAMPIRQWDIWNEPYVSRFWQDDFPDPEGYARMFKAVVETARPADPTARFLLEADTRVIETGWPWKPFLARMFDAVPNLGNYADAVSIHPYQGGGESPHSCSRFAPSRGVARDWRATVLQFCRIADIRRILDANGARRTNMWITEVGWSTAPAAESGVTEARQADYVHDVFEMLRGRYAGLVSGVIWYEYQSGEENPALEDDYFGLVRPDGTPKPAWTALAHEAVRGLRFGKRRM